MVTLYAISLCGASPMQKTPVFEFSGPGGNRLPDRAGQGRARRGGVSFASSESNIPWAGALGWAQAIATPRQHVPQAAHMAEHFHETHPQQRHGNGQVDFQPHIGDHGLGDQQRGNLLTSGRRSITGPELQHRAFPIPTDDHPADLAHQNLHLAASDGSGAQQFQQCAAIRQPLRAAFVELSRRDVSHFAAQLIVIFACV